MRIAGGIIALFLALIILIQSAAAGTADAIQGKGSGGSFGFFVGVLFVIGGALLIGNVMKGSIGVFAFAGLIAWIGAASSIFGDLWVWGAVAFIYAGTSYWSVRKARASEGAAATNPTA